MNTNELRELGLELWTQKPRQSLRVIARSLTDTVGIPITTGHILKWAAKYGWPARPSNRKATS